MGTFESRVGTLAGIAGPAITRSVPVFSTGLASCPSELEVSSDSGEMQKWRGSVPALTLMSSALNSETQFLYQSNRNHTVITSVQPLPRPPGNEGLLP